MRFKILIVILMGLISVGHGSTKYELEFLDERIFAPCENQADKFIDIMFNISNLNFLKTIEGSLLVDGYAMVTQSLNEPLDLSGQVYKKVRGTWQPTVFNVQRKDLCKSMFSKTDVWHTYFDQIADEQRTCPFTVGQRIDVNISEPIYISLPTKNGEGEYLIHIRTYGTENKEPFLCTRVFVNAYKI